MNGFDYSEVNGNACMTHAWEIALWHSSVCDEVSVMKYCFLRPLNRNLFAHWSRMWLGKIWGVSETREAEGVSSGLSSLKRYVPLKSNCYFIPLSGNFIPLKFKNCCLPLFLFWFCASNGGGREMYSKLYKNTWTKQCHIFCVVSIPYKKCCCYHKHLASDSMFPPVWSPIFNLFLLWIIQTIFNAAELSNVP